MIVEDLPGSASQLRRAFGVEVMRRVCDRSQRSVLRKPSSEALREMLNFVSFSPALKRFCRDKCSRTLDARFRVWWEALHEKLKLAERNEVDEDAMMSVSLSRQSESGTIGFQLFGTSACTRSIQHLVTSPMTLRNLSSKPQSR